MDYEGEDNEITTITITRGLKKRIANLGKKGDTYEMILEKLLSGVKNEITN